MRGSSLHNYLGLEVKTIAESIGCHADLECGLALPDGGKTFLDVVVFKEGRRIGVEVETTTRNVVANAIKAQALELPLVIVVPNRSVQKNAERVLLDQFRSLQNRQIWISLIPGLAARLEVCFSDCSSANDTRKQKSRTNCGSSRGQKGGRMKIKWHNIYALGAILIVILILGQVGGQVDSFFESLSDNSRPRHRTPNQIMGAIIFVGLFIAGLLGLTVYLDMKR